MNKILSMIIASTFFSNSSLLTIGATKQDVNKKIPEEKTLILNSEKAAKENKATKGEGLFTKLKNFFKGFFKDFSENVAIEELDQRIYIPTKIKPQYGLIVKKFITKDNVKYLLEVYHNKSMPLGKKATKFLVMIINPEGIVKTYKTYIDDLVLDVSDGKLSNKDIKLNKPITDFMNQLYDVIDKNFEPNYITKKQAQLLMQKSVQKTMEHSEEKGKAGKYGKTAIKALTSTNSQIVNESIKKEINPANKKSVQKEINSANKNQKAKNIEK